MGIGSFDTQSSRQIINREQRSKKKGTPVIWSYICFYIQDVYYIRVFILTREQREFPELLGSWTRGFKRMRRHGRPTRNGIKQPAGIDHEQTALASVIMALQYRLGLLFHGDGHGMRRRIITQPNDFGRIIIAASCQRLEFGNGVRGRRKHLGTRLFGQDLNIASFLGRKGSTQVYETIGKGYHYFLRVVVVGGSMIIGRQGGDAK